jgi:hypothetical protein
MKLRFAVAAFLMICIPFFGEAQGKGNNGKGNKEGKGNSGNNGNNGKKVVVKSNSSNKSYKTYKKNKVVKVKNGPPSWAKAHGYRNNRHVYFPDYYTFYDPNRGYVYWNDGNWIATPTVPSFLTTVDLGAARIHVLTNEQLTVRPETRYNTYVGQYPGRLVGVAVPIPPRR